MSEDQEKPNPPSNAASDAPEIRSATYPRSPFPSSRAYLKQLLSERNQHPHRATEIDQQIQQTFERRAALLALDMCGFTELSIEYGIIHYLAMIRQMEDVATPAVVGNGGTVIKQDADNLFAIFNEPAQALEAALDIFRAFDAVNRVVTVDRQIHGSIGIGYGETLIIGNEDLFSAEMNLACKLGEDIAERAEILITPAAFAALPAGRYVCRPVQFTLGQLEIHCYHYERSLYPDPQHT